MLSLQTAVPIRSLVGCVQRRFRLKFEDPLLNLEVFCFLMIYLSILNVFSYKLQNIEFEDIYFTSENSYYPKTLFRFGKNNMS